MSVKTSTEEIRIIIRVCVSNLPGDPQRRHVTLGELLAEHVIHRPLSLVPTDGAYDEVYIPSHYDSTKPVSRWFIYDINVQGSKTTEELLSTPHKVYQACFDNDKWQFVEKPNWVDGAKTRCKMRCWGHLRQKKSTAVIDNYNCKDALRE